MTQRCKQRGRKTYKSCGHFAIEVMNMTVTLETIYQEIQRVKSELHRVRSVLEDEGELTDEARRDVERARRQMARGKYVTHEEIMAKYG